MNWVKKFSLACGGIIIVLLILYVFPLKSSVNTTVKGVQCRINDNNYIENVTINIKGDYKRYLFKNDTFNGTITLDNNEFTLGDSYVTLEFNKNKSYLIYKNVVEGKATQYPLGTIYCSPNFKKLLICINEKTNSDSVDTNTKSYHWNAANGLFVSAPSLNRKQAIDIANELVESNVADTFR